MRYTWPDVTGRACETAAEVHLALRQRGYPAPLKPCSPACQAVNFELKRSRDRRPSFG